MWKSRVSDAEYVARLAKAKKSRPLRRWLGGVFVMLGVAYLVFVAILNHDIDHGRGMVPDSEILNVYYRMGLMLGIRLCVNIFTGAWMILCGIVLLSRRRAVDLLLANYKGEG